MQHASSLSPGLAAIILVSGIALLTSTYFPGGMVLHALLWGFICGQILGVPMGCQAGLNFSEKFLLSLGVGLMGLGLSVSQLTSLGLTSVFLLITSMATAFLSAYLLSRFFNLSRGFIILSAIGNAICGASAIAAAAPVVKARQEDTGLAIAIVNGLGSIWMFLMPLLFLSTSLFTDEGSAQIIGSTLQAVGHVSGAGFAMSEQVGNLAVTLKLGRVALLGPVLLVLAFVSGDQTKLSFPLPWFIILFFALAILRGLWILPEELLNSSAFIAKLLLAMGMAAVGWKIQWANIKDQSKHALWFNLLISSSQILILVGLVFLVRNIPG